APAPPLPPARARRPSRAARRHRRPKRPSSRGPSGADRTTASRVVRGAGPRRADGLRAFLVSPKSEKAPLAARRGRRISLAIFTLFAASFIGLSTVEIARQVYGYSSTYPEVTGTCAYALKWFEEGIDRGGAQAMRQRTPGHTEDSFQGAVQMQFDTVQKQCSAPGDQEAVVAVGRLREAAL